MKLKNCSDNVSSVQKSFDKQHIHNFPWANITDEIITHCPTLFHLLLVLTKPKTPRKNHLSVICGIVCMLTKFGYSKMSLFQRLISSVFYSGHVSLAVSPT